MSNQQNDILDEMKAEAEEEKKNYEKRVAYLSEVDGIIIKALEGTK